MRLNLADMKKERRKFDKEFKIMAVELCLSGKPTSEVAEELGIRSELLGRWKREYQQKKDGSFSGHGKPALSPEQAEIARLKKQLREAEIERDILKKAGAAPQWASSPGTTANLPVYEKAPTYVCC